MDTLTAAELLAVPADLSLRSLRGWTAGVRLYVLGFAPASPERVAAIEEARRQVGYAGWIIRKTSPKAVAFLGEQHALLGNLTQTIV